MPPSIRPKKSLGQNFLTDTSIIDRILASIAPSDKDDFFEIGPGLGALTCPLLSIVKKMTAVEIDQRLIGTLKEKCVPIGELALYNKDILDFNLKDLLPEKHSLRIVGNLPYSISTPLLFHLLKQTNSIRDMHFMLQKEVADRITAKVGAKAYGRLTVMIQYACQTEKLFNVPAHAFHPRPKVESAIIKLIPYHTLPYAAKNTEHFSELVKQAFMYRRKTVANATQKMTKGFDWEKINLDPTTRPEKISVEFFVKMSNMLVP